MNPNKILLLIIAVGIFSCSSCIERSYLHSPVQGNTFAYRSMPLASDSVKSATYISSALSLGTMNDKWQDEVFSLQAGIHRSHVLDHFRMNYGASLSAGSYNTGRESYNIYYQNRFSLPTGGKFFGAYGAYGGISAAKPMGRRGEFRFIGVEGSIFKEFGDYYNLRKSLPDSATNETDKHNYLGSAGLTMEFIFKGRSKHEFGIKLAGGSFLWRLNYYNAHSNGYDYQSHDDLLYFSNTYHFTFKKNTTFFQFNIATHAAHFLIGFSHRL